MPARPLQVVAAVAAAALVWLGLKKARRREDSRPQAAPKQRSRRGFAALVGNTKLVRVEALCKATGCEVWAKAEFLNPGGSTKDRVARQIVEDAEDSGLLPPGGTLVEGTSGSTGISLSLMARSCGYQCKIFMPDDQAKEKSDLLTMFGVDVERVQPVSIVNANHYVNLARSFADEHDGCVFTDQFENLSNYKAHYTTTGPEIWRQTSGKVDAFVMGSGTGGTIAGVSTFLKERRPGVKVFLVDPQGSSLYNHVKHGVCYADEQAEARLKRHRYDTIVEGIGIDRVTRNYGKASVDDAFRVTDQEAVYMARWLLRHEGLFVGSSSATNCVGVVKAARSLPPGSTIVTLLCDGGSRHLTRFWNPEFLQGRGLTAELPPDGGLGFVA